MGSSLEETLSKSRIRNLACGEIYEIYSSYASTFLYMVFD